MPNLKDERFTSNLKDMERKLKIKDTQTALLAAEYGFTCAESGLDIEAMKLGLLKLLKKGI